MELRIVILHALISIALIACESDAPCSENVISRVNAGLYTIVDDDEFEFTAGELSIYGISRPDSVLQGSNVKYFDFPLSMNAESSSFILTADAMTDTLELFYTSKLAFISTQCGFTATRRS